MQLLCKFCVSRAPRDGLRWRHHVRATKNKTAWRHSTVSRPHALVLLKTLPTYPNGIERQKANASGRVFVNNGGVGWILALIVTAIT
jgi:hypothetical protein